MKLVSSKIRVLGFVKSAQVHCNFELDSNFTGFLLFLIGFSKNVLGKKEKEPGK